MKRVINGPETKEGLPTLLEGYLYGLGEVCHNLFGPEGEVAMYSAIGSYFLNYLKRKMGIEFLDHDPWEQYCHIVAVFTSYGFYAHVELEKRDDNVYWMLESDQYAGGVWEEQGAWERGTPPCPLWSIILYSLSRINYTIVLDSVTYNEKYNGFESTFHFEKIEDKDKDVLNRAKKEIRSAIIPICGGCKKIRDDKGNWVNIETYFTENFEAKFSHGLCPECSKKYFSKLDN
ncbi:MAG: hypothetical protein R6V04_06510 [bacterium]